MRNNYDLLDLKKELKNYSKVCKQKKIKYNKYDIDISIGFSQWKEDIISKIKASVERKNIANKDKEKEYIINYLHYVANQKRIYEYDKDPFINILVFLISVLFSGLISLNSPQITLGAFFIFMLVFSIIFSFRVLLYYSKKSFKIYFFDDVISILEEYIEKNYRE